MVNRTKDRKKTAVLNHLNNKSTGDYIGETMKTSKFSRKKNGASTLLEKR